MVRTISEEGIVCRNMRKKYFENPKYRKWSDITPLQANGYGNRLEYAFFVAYIMGKDDASMDADKLYTLLDDGHNLPIDWSALYIYFDERFADNGNCALDELTQPVLSSKTHGPTRWSIMDILNHYREFLLSNSYDMI